MSEDDPQPPDRKPMPFLLSALLGVVLICLFSLAVMMFGRPA